MPDDPADNLRAQLDLHRRRLAHDLEQQRTLGVYTPFYVDEDIRACRVAIGQCKAALRALGHAADDAPGDEPTPAERASAPPFAAEQHGDSVGGDKIGGDKIGGDKHENHYHMPPPDDPAEARRIEQALLAALPTDAVPQVAPLPMPHRMPYTPNPQFVGREADFTALAATLKHGTTTVIAAATGMGGVGKTQLAAEIAHRYGQFFAGGVFWLSFAEASGVDAEIAACGAAMQLPAFDALDLPTQVARVRQIWQEPTPRLLVFDNCEDDALLARYRPTSGGCRVLVTSRRQQWDSAPGVAARQLDTLERAESIALLRAFRPDLAADDPDLAALADALGDLPLALHVAGSYLRRYQHATTPAAYGDKLRAAPLQAFALRANESLPTGHERDVARTFLVSYAQIQSDDPTDRAAQALLHRAAYFAPGEPIPRDLLLLTLHADDDALPNSDDDEQALLHEDALKRLGDLGLLKEEDDVALRLHRLLAAFAQQVAQQAAADATAQHAAERALNDRAAQLNEDGYPLALLLLQVHLRHVTDAALPRADAAAAGLCNTLGYLLQAQSDYAAARPYYEQALYINEQVLGPQHPDTATSLNNLGYLLQAQGDYAAARPYYEQALYINEQVLGPQHPDTATSLNNLGELLRAQGNYVEARRYHEQALAIRQQVLEPQHSATAISLNNLGLLLDSIGEYGTAREYLEQALTIRQQVFPAQHPATAQSLNVLGGLLILMGEYGTAREYLEQALTIRQQVFPAQHPDTVRSLNNLAVLYAYQEQFAEAAEYMRQALAIFEQVLGADHPDTRSSRQNLAAIEQRLRGAP